MRVNQKQQKKLRPVKKQNSVEGEIALKDSYLKKKPKSLRITLKCRKTAFRGIYD